MEQQAGYWMWRKRRNDLSCHDLESSTNMANTYYESWEEQAFAEDASGGAGCIWPPRSYCCSFCGREFRSAQALGGHMNVHRRDRARLKQSSPTPHGRDDLHHQGIQNPFLPMGFQCQSDEVCNPNPSTKEKSPDHQQTCVSDPFSSPIFVQERAKKSQKYSLSNLASDNRHYRFSDLRTDHEGDGDHTPRILQPEYVQTDMSASKQGITFGCKRKRSDHSTPTTTLPFFLKPISIEKRHHIHSPSEDGIDLELRLGDPPKVPRHSLNQKLYQLDISLHVAQ